jgi:MoxR-like ATPase
MAVGASNELPAEREELEALWDRFLLRYLVSYLREERSFEALMLRNGAGGGGEDKSVLSEEALKVAREEAGAVDASGVVPHLSALRRELSEAGIVASDRRYKKCLSLLRAHAFLEGRKKATDDDLSVLAHALWSDPSQLRDVRKAVMERANPHLHKAQDLLDEASEVHKQAMNAPEEEQTNKGQEANAKLKGITNRLLSLRSEAEKEGRLPERIDEVLKAVATMNREVVARCLGITM